MFQVKRYLGEEEAPQESEEEDLSDAKPDEFFQLLKIKEVRFIGKKRASIKSLGLDFRIVEVLNSLSIEHFFPSQTSILPIIFQTIQGCSGVQRDIVVEAPTGSGKTLCYVLPLVQSLSKGALRLLRALVVVPTRELALQVHKVFEQFCSALSLSVGLTVGAHSMLEEQRKLISNFNRWENNALRSGPYDCKRPRSGVDILVSTPGRLVDHLERTKGFTLEHLQFIIVDEVDRLIRQPYTGWLKKIKANTDPHFWCDNHVQNRMKFRAKRSIHPRMKMIFSATIPRQPYEFQKLKLRAPIVFLASARTKFTLPSTLKQFRVSVADSEKPLALAALLDDFQPKSTLVFTLSLETTHRLFHFLQLFGFQVREYSSYLKPKTKTKILKLFLKEDIKILVCSDAVARGLDLPDVDCVINYDIPTSVHGYLHRVGRTARAGNAGTAFTLLEPDDSLEDILSDLGKKSLKDYNIPTETWKSRERKYKGILSQLEEVIRQERKS